MSDVPVRPDLGQLRKRAKDLKRAVLAGDAAAVDRVLRWHPKYAGRPADRFVPARMSLRDAQATLARELGFPGWRDLVEAAERAGQGQAAPRWSRQADHALLRRSFDQAQRLGQGWCGPEHVLLALLDPPGPTVAATVLREAGLTAEAVAERLRRTTGAAGGTPRGIATNPAWGACAGMAQGVALAAGSREVRDEHALLALVYEGRLDDLLDDGGDLAPAELVARLAEHGVAVPALLPPEAPPPAGPPGPRVYFPCADHARVTKGLAERVRPGVRWGWNTDGDGRRCWAGGEDEADLPALVRSLVTDPTAVEVVPFEEALRRDRR